MRDLLDLSSAMVLTVETVALEGETAVFSLEGSLDAMGAAELRSSCSLAREEGCKHVIFDLARVDMISSTGVGALLIANEDFEDLGGGALFAAPSPEVLSVLRCMDLDSVIEIVRSCDEARERLLTESS